jgi:hypothetical protein
LKFWSFDVFKKLGFEKRFANMAGEDSEESRGGDEMSLDYNESERQDTSR